MSVLEAIVSSLGWLLRGKRAGDQHSVRTAPQPDATHTTEVSAPAFPTAGASSPIKSSSSKAAGFATSDRTSPFRRARR